MLVVDPAKRSSLSQVKRHSWMMTEVPPEAQDMAGMDEKEASVGGQQPAQQQQQPDQPNEQILRLMQSLGVDPLKTKESLQHERYDHHAAIYYLLLERRSHLTASAPATDAKLARISEQASSEGTPLAPLAPAAPATVHRARPALWTHSPPFRDSACGDSVDSERGSVGGSLLSPLVESVGSSSSGAALRHAFGHGRPTFHHTNTFSVDEGVEDDQSPLGSAAGSSDSTFGAFSAEPTERTAPGQHVVSGAEGSNPSSQRLKGNQALGLPALFHEGRRASEDLVCMIPCAPPTACSSRGAVPEIVPLSETHREHKALCLRYSKEEQQSQQGKEPMERCRNVLRQVSYQLAQQQDVLSPFDGKTVAELQRTFQTIEEDDNREVLTERKSESEWCQLPTSLAACDLNLSLS